MFNPWNAANSGNAGDQSSRFPCVPPWTQFLSQSGWLNHGASMAPGINFNVMPRAPMSQAFVGGFPGFVPQSQPPPPPPPSNAASPPEPPKTNSQPPPPPSYPTSGVVSSRTMDFEKEWQKYQDSLQVGPNQSTSPSNATGNPQLQEVIEEENKFNEQFNEWKKQCESWKESNKCGLEKSHPDKQLYYQYEQQWQQYEHQMLDRQNEIRQKKEQLMRSLQSQQRPATSQFQLSMPQSPASISGWQMPEVRPSNSQAHPNSQNWNQPGGKGEQVNFGQDINQRFQSAGQQYRPNNPQIEQRFAWQRHQRPLLDNPVECPGFMPRPQGNRFSSSLAQHQGPRMGNLRYKPPEPNPQLQPWSRSPGVHNRLVQPKATQISQVGPRPGNGDAKNVSLAPTPSLLGNPSMPRPRPLLADPNTIRNKSLQSPRIREEIPPRFGTPRRPPLLPGNEYEIESKRMRLSVPEHNMNLRAQQSPHKRFPPPPFVPRLPLTGGTILPDLRPRLQMMGPRFRRQGAAAVSQEFQSRNCSQEQVNTHKPHEADTGSSEFQGVLGEGAKKSEAESVDNSGGQTSKEENAKDHAIPEKQETNDLKVIEGDKLAASSSNATNYRPTDPKPVGESKMGHDTTDPANKVLQVHGENGAPVSEVPKEQVRRLSVGESTEINKEFVGSSKWNANPECDDKNYSCDVEDQWPGGRRRDSDLRGDRHFYEDKHQGEQGGGHAFKQPLHWESDQDWRDRSWSKNWSREPVVHDYQHQCAPFSADGMPMTEDKDERYPPGLFHPANNPYVATVIDYGHGGLEQDPPLISNRGFAAPPPLEEAIFKHDQDFRTPPPFFNRNTDFVPPPIHARELAPHHLQRIVPRPEEPLIEKIPIETLILPPGRTFRPDHLVIMVRGLPGAGKTYISKLIKEREIKEGGTAPRLLSLDDYFITEVEKVIEDPETGKKIKKMVMEYEYDQALEASYKTSFLKSFKKHVDDLYFTFIIVDATFDKKLYMDEFWNYAKSKGFQVYVIEVEADVNTCARRNDHQRTLTDIQKIKDGWDETPRHYLQLDAQFLLHGNIEEVEMDNSSAILEAEVAEQNNDPEEGDDSSEPGQQKSKWELDTSEQHLDKLDGLKTPKKVKTLEEYLQVPEDYEERSSIPGKKRVRWADIEEKKELERMRKLGFVVGYTDWDKLNDDSCAEKALIKTKYI